MGIDTSLERLTGNATFRFAEAERMLTPALVIDRDRVQHNIQTTLRLLGGDANRWRPHVKTAKLGYVMRMLVAAGVQQFKCATSLELSVACQAGAGDVLVAYPLVGANAARVREIADHHPSVAVSVLVENEAQLAQWKGTPVAIFIDVNPGMNRTGVPDDRGDAILRLAQSIVSSGLRFRGLHYYDGHLSKFAIEDRCKHAHTGYERLMQIVDTLAAHGLAAEDLAIPEVITAGTPAFPCSLSFPPFRFERLTSPSLKPPQLKAERFLHRVSPGTVVYCDTTSLAQLAPKSPESMSLGYQLASESRESGDLGYQPAAVVMTRVVSHPAPGLITCDAGHKTVSADAGVPTCAVLGHPELEPLTPSEEHLPMRVTGTQIPHIGQLLFLIPRHVCPTVNNFDEALLISGGKLLAVEPVSARGRELQKSW
jgi:D-serine deaminase-like pyridoxal phosphate-dependent protein